MPRPVYELHSSVSLFFGLENQWRKERTGAIIIAVTFNTHYWRYRGASYYKTGGNRYHTNVLQR